MNPAGQSKRRQLLTGLAILGLILISADSIVAQGVEPESLTSAPGIHLLIRDGLQHKAASHYEALCQVVIREFGIRCDAFSLNIVFIGEDLRDHLSRNNQTRFEAKDWTAAYVHPSLIFMVGADESDDTFMHEFMHFLNDRGLLFANVPGSRVHATITRNEGLLLGSKSYLEYLQSLK